VVTFVVLGLRVKTLDLAVLTTAAHALLYVDPNSLRRLTTERSEARRWKA
jgi:hypothetical protein